MPLKSLLVVRACNRNACFRAFTGWCCSAVAVVDPAGARGAGALVVAREHIAEGAQ